MNANARVPEQSARSPLDETIEPPRPARPKRWRRRLRCVAIASGIVLLAAYLIVWWVALRIVENPSWPPPTDAVTSNGAQAITEEFARRDDVAIPYAPSTASDVRLHLDGPEFFPAMPADIEAAEWSIHLQMFGMTPGEIAGRFTEALARKARSGVEVRLIVDFYGAKVDAGSRPYFDDLTAAGVEVVVNNVFPSTATACSTNTRSTGGRTKLASPITARRWWSRGGLAGSAAPDSRITSTAARSTMSSRGSKATWCARCRPRS